MNATITTRVPVWIINFYHNGEFESTHEEAMPERDAKIFCDAFNRLLGNDWQAVAVESVAVAKVPRLAITPKRLAAG